MEMHDHGHHSDVGKAKCVIVKCGQVQSIKQSESCFLISSWTIMAVMSSLMVASMRQIFSCWVAALALAACMGTGPGCTGS